MNLRPFNSGELEKLKTLGYNPADYAGYDVDAGEAVPQIEVDKRSTLAPSNPYMAAVAEPLLRTGADLYRAGRRFPQAAAEMLLGKDADAGLRTVGATPITGLNFLAEQVLSSAARGSAAQRQPGTADTLLSGAAGITSAIAPYLVNPMLGLSASAMQGAGAGSEKAQAMGATPGQELTSMLGRAGISAALDKVGMLGAATTPFKALPMAKLAARGAVEGAATQTGFNVADKVTFNPNQDLSEGVGTSALVGGIAPTALRSAGAGIDAWRGNLPPTIPTISPRAETERINRMGYDERVAALPELNKRLREAGKPEMTLDQFGGPAGNRLAPQAIQQFADLALTTGEGSAMGSPNEQLAARAIKSGIIRRDSPTFEADVRAVFNIGETALREIQVRALNEGAAGEQTAVANTLRSLENETKIGQSIDKRQAEVDKAMAAAEAARRAAFEKQGQARQAVNDKAAAEAALAKQAEADAAAEREETARFEAAEGRQAEAALRAQYELPAEFMFSAVDTKGKIAEAKKYGKARSAGLREGFEGKTPYDPASPLGQLQQASLSSVTPGPRPMSAEQTLLAQREQGEVDRMKAAAAEQAAQQAVKGAVQTEATLTPAPESAVTAVLAKAPTPTPKPEDSTTGDNAKPAVTTAATVPKVGKNAAIKPNAPSQAPEGSPAEAGKSSPAPTSVPLPGKSPTSSALTVPASTPNPSAAEVVAAGGSKAATPVNPQITSALPQIPEDVANTVQTVLMDLWQRDRTNPLRQQLVQLSQDVQAGRQPLSALTSALPKDKVAAPVATVESKPAVKTEASVEPVPIKLTDAEKAELQAELSGETAKPEAKLGSPERMRAFDEKEKARLPDDILNQSREIEGLRSTIKDLEPYAKGLKAGDYDVAQYKERLKTRRAELKAATDELKATQQRAKDYGLPHTVAAIEKASASPAPLKIKKQTTQPDPLAADRQTLDAAGLTVRKGKRGNWELYNKDIDEVTRDLGGMADEAEAVKEAARIIREESKQGIGSKMRSTRRSEEGSIINPAELIEAGGRAVAAGARSMMNRVRSATNQLGDFGDSTGDEIAKYGHRKLNETATVAAVDATKIINENQSFWSKLNSSERADLTDILQYERAWRKRWPGDMSPRVEQAYLETRNLMRELGERAAREGPRIQEGKEWRPLIVDEFWVPEALSMKVVKELQDTSIDKATGRVKRDIKLDELRDWARQNGLSDKQMDTEIKRFDIENKTADADLEFDALHRPMTIPLPPGWAGNTQDAINRYATKYAFEMARHKYIDQDKLLGPMSRGQRESLDDLGRLTQRPDEAGQVGDTTDALFRAALNSFALQINPGRQPLVARLSGVANPLAVQTGATIRDVIMMASPLIDDAGAKNALKGLLEGVTKYRDLKARGLIRDTGNLSGDAQRIGEAFSSWQILEGLRDAARMANRGMGVDALNKFMQAVSSAAGIARAKEAMAKNDDAFFKKVGIPEWRAKTPEEVEDFVARWVVEGSQGSMGAKDQPTHMLKSSGAGAQFAPILRWAFAFTNQQIDRAFKPLMDKDLTAFERVKPLATRLVGAAGASALANLMLQSMFGRDDRNPSFKEWQAAGYPLKLKYAFQKATDLQLLPIVTTIANVFSGNQQLPRNLGVEAIPNTIREIMSMSELNREFKFEDFKTAADAVFDKSISNWRDASKVAGGEVKDPIEQARARYDNMHRATILNLPANQLNLTTQFNKAKTVDEVREIAQKMVETATLNTPDEVSVKGPSEDAAFEVWLKKTNPELWNEYRRDNTMMAVGLDSVYNEKKKAAEAVKKLIKEKKLLLASKEPNDVKRAKVLKLNWEEGGTYELK
jgi:hypothetical protein